MVFSGDYAWADAEGYLYFAGRKDQQLKVSGIRVSPEEIEAVLADIDGVSECAVMGLGSDEAGDRIVAFLLSDGPFDSDAVMRHCRQRLPAYMRPRRLVPVAAMPRLSNGKIDRGALRRGLAAPATEEAESHER